MLHTHLAHRWLSPKQIDLFIAVYQYGPKPVATLAKLTNQERTNTYKMLAVLESKGLVSQVVKKNTKHYLVPSRDIFKHLTQQEKQHVQESERLLSIVEHELWLLEEKRHTDTPKIQIYEWNTWLKQFFATLQQHLSQKNYKQIRCIASNTLEEQSNAREEFGAHAHDFLQYLNQQWIYCDLTTGTGIMILEQLIKDQWNDDLEKLPAGQGSSSIFLMGELIGIIVFKATPTGVTIHSQELASLLTFMVKNTNSDPL